jgi:hypothetical protein
MLDSVWSIGAAEDIAGRTKEVLRREVQGRMKEDLLLENRSCWVATPGVVVRSILSGVRLSTREMRC